MMDNAIEAWRNGRIPLVNAVTYADGRMILLSRAPTGRETVVVKPIADTTLASFLTYNPDWWCEIGVWTEVVLPEGKAVAGDGGFEEDGFIARLDADGELVYSVFFDFSEPFREVRVEEGKIVALTEEATWRFDLEKPWIIRVELFPLRSWEPLPGSDTQ